MVLPLSLSRSCPFFIISTGTTLVQATSTTSFFFFFLHHLLPELPAFPSCPCTPLYTQQQENLYYRIRSYHSLVSDPPMMPCTVRNKPKLQGSAKAGLLSLPVITLYLLAHLLTMSWSLHTLFLLMQKLSSQFLARPANSFSNTDLS